MDIEYIKRFIVVGQSLNFSKAAEALFISQPTLSHSITTLEKKLGAPLLIRNTKSVKLTRAGERFLPAAIQIVDLYESAVQDISNDLGYDGSVLNVGYIGPALDNMLAPWVKTFRQAHPNAKVRILRFPTPEMEEAFGSRSIHMALLYQMHVHTIPGLKYQVVSRERFMLCLNGEHPLAGRTRIALRELGDEPFLICKRASSPTYYDRVLEICANRGYKPNISQESRLVSDIYRLVGAELGVALMTYSPTRDYSSYNIKFVEIDEGEDLGNNIVLAWKGSLPPLARKFKDIALEGAPSP